VHGLVYGVILGSVLFLGIQIPGLIRFGFRWSPAIDWRDPGVRQVLTVLGPRVLTVFFIQIVFLAQDNLASRMVVGAVTALVTGWLIMQLPETLIGTAIGTALLPTLSEQIARRETRAFQDSLNRAVQVILAVSLPGAVLLSLVLRPLVGIFGFDSAGSELVVWTSRAFLAGLVGHSLLEVAVRSFYAQQNAHTPLLAAGLMFITFVMLASLLGPFLGPAGIALANSIAFTTEAVLLLWLLNRQFKGIIKIGGLFARLAAGTLLAGLIAYLVINSRILAGLPVFQDGLLSGVLHTAIAFATGFVVILPFIWSEARMLVRL
jgi:putative peptidoglycan lipid II flippase